jgi:hypothetical protein
LAALDAENGAFPDPRSALQRDTLPHEEFVEVFVRACGVDPVPWLVARKRLAVAEAEAVGASWSADEPDEAAGICAEIRTPLWQGRALDALGTVLLTGGDVRAAEDAWTQARQLFAAAGSPEAAEVTASIEDS